MAHNPSTAADAQAVLKAYSDGMLKLGLRSPSTSPALIAGAKIVAAWCRGAGIDPRRYVVDRMARSGWRGLTMRQLQGSARFVANHKLVGDRRVAAVDEHNALSVSVVDDDPDGKGELVPAAELAKHTLRGNREVCRLSAEVMTLGFDPRSAHCRACSLFESCAPSVGPT